MATISHPASRVQLHQLALSNEKCRKYSLPKNSLSSEQHRGLRINLPAPTSVLAICNTALNGLQTMQRLRMSTTASSHLILAVVINLVHWLCLVEHFFNS